MYFYARNKIPLLLFNYPPAYLPGETVVSSLGTKIISHCPPVSTVLWLNEFIC